MAIICKYKFDSTLCADYLPEFNSEFTGYTKTDIDNGDNTITRTIEHDTLLPTLIRFGKEWVSGGNNDPDDRSKSLLEMNYCNTSNVTDISWMFSNCTSLTSLDLSNFDTSKVTNMSYMFYGCKKLTSLDLSNWQMLSNCQHTDWLRNCTRLTSSNVTTTNANSTLISAVSSGLS